MSLFFWGNKNITRNLIKYVYKSHRCFHAHDGICWKCGTAIMPSSIMCKSCCVLQPPTKNKHYFNLFDVHDSYDINLPELSSKYHKLQAVLHPDKFSNKTEEEKKISEEYSSLVNKAYSTLSSDISRGLYMLHLHGKHIEESSMTGESKLLTDVMELNEELDECNDQQSIEKFSKKIEEKLQSLISNISTAFKQKDIELAQKLLTEMKYYVSIKDKILQKKQSLNIPG